MKKTLQHALQELAAEAVHPSAEEIGLALDGKGSPFATAEVRAHLGWCDVCRAVGTEYEGFRATPVSTPAEDDAAWAAMQRRLPSVPAKPWRWLPMAAALAVVGGPALTWWAMNNRPPVIQERLVERVVERPAPVALANAAVLDLFPEGSATRSGSATALAPVPAGAGVVTFILHGATGEENSVRVVDGAAKELWRGSVRRQSGEFLLALSAETLARRPLWIECGQFRYRVP